MAYTLIRHKVADFAKWKQAFDASESIRSAVGEESWEIFRDEDFPELVTVLTKFETGQHAHHHLSSENFKETMHKAGVIGDVDIHFLKKVD